MSREAVNQIIDRAVADEAFFGLLRDQPDRALEGYSLDPSETSAFRSGAYNVVVRATRKDREDELALDTKKTQAVDAAAAQRREQAAAAATPAPTQPRTPIAGLLGFLAGIVIIGGGIGGFRYVENQWPWQALGFDQAAAQASIPSPTLGARPRSSGPANTSSRASASGAAQGSSVSRATGAGQAGSASQATGAGQAGSASQAAGTGQARLRPSAGASGAAGSSVSPAQGIQIEKAYYQSVGARLNTASGSFASLLSTLRAGNDASKDVASLSTALADLNQHLDDAPPPAQLKQQHQTLVEAMPLLQSDVTQMKTALDQKNNVQAILVAAEIGAILNQVPDEVTFATTPHPELYQPINSTQQLDHIVQFDVINQNLTARNNAPGTVQLRIGLQAANPSPAEVSDTLRHGVVAARQTYPQAGQVHIAAFKEANGAQGSQVGSADWYCSPDAHAPGAPANAGWQDSCSKIYVNTGGGAATAVPY